MSKGRKTNYVTQQQLNTLRGGKGIGHIHTNKETLDMILFDEENNAVYLGSPDNKINFYVFGELTAGGIGSGGGGDGGDVTSIVIEGVTQQNEDGVVTLDLSAYASATTLSAIETRVSELEQRPAGGVSSVVELTGDISKSDLQSALELGSLAYKSELEVSDIPTLPLDKIEGLDILDYFEYDSANHAVRLKDNVVEGKQLSFYAYGEITAGGVGNQTASLPRKCYEITAHYESGVIICDFTPQQCSELYEELSVNINADIVLSIPTAGQSYFMSYAEKEDYGVRYMLTIHENDKDYIMTVLIADGYVLIVKYQIETLKPIPQDFDGSQIETMISNLGLESVDWLITYTDDTTETISLIKKV